MSVRFPRTSFGYIPNARVRRRGKKKKFGKTAYSNVIQTRTVVEARLRIKREKHSTKKPTAFAPEFRTWTKFATLVGHGKLLGHVAVQRRALGFRIDLVALDHPVQANAAQARFQVYRVPVLEHDVAFGPARFCGKSRVRLILLTIYKGRWPADTQTYFGKTRNIRPVSVWGTCS